ncbi:MAG: response regulator transcription factor [Clostridia bacterium]|nr:response regulator transcription factor [Clostridia bacterium]
MLVPKIMIVEDEERLRKVIIKYLVNEGYQVIEAKDGKEALDYFYSQDLDLVILDIMMPEYDGWSVCRAIRKESEIPILMLTARSEESDRLFGFELGADDYVTKPFSLKELVMRVKALLKRTGNITDNEKKISDIKIDIKSHKVYIKDQEVELSPKEYDLLLYFGHNIGLALTRENILDKVWGYDYYGDLRTVDTHVKRLRKKINKSSDVQVKTVRGVGYRFEVTS